MINNTRKLCEELKAVCPIISVNSNGVIEFDPSATQPQIDAANAVLAAFVDTPDDDADINLKATKLMKAICIYFGQQVGKTPAQVRAGIKTVYESLP